MSSTLTTVRLAHIQNTADINCLVRNLRLVLKPSIPILDKPYYHYLRLNPRIEFLTSWTTVPQLLYSETYFSTKTFTFYKKRYYLIVIIQSCQYPSEIVTQVVYTPLNSKSHFSLKFFTPRVLHIPLIRPNQRSRWHASTYNYKIVSSGGLLELPYLTYQSVYDNLTFDFPAARHYPYSNKLLKEVVKNHIYRNSQAYFGFLQLCRQKLNIDIYCYILTEFPTLIYYTTE